mgnify:FL=1
MKYEIVCGLEVHVEMNTKTKIFCGCTTAFGGAPNTHTCPVCTGQPGALPVLNRAVVEGAMSTGLALGCEITRLTRFDRKNYFYPDLPKAYQISQLYAPICTGGGIAVTTDGGEEKYIRLHEIHMEEDAGKLVHDPWTESTLCDYNRCGVPLMEIVTEPDFRSAHEVIDFLTKLRSTLQFLGVSDCKMQEGSIRADLNVSVRPAGSEKLGTRTEMKNMNSFKAIAKAIETEAARQIDVLEEGRAVKQETRRWDDNKDASFAMRSKENAQDYRYFPEPDLPPVYIDDAWLERVRAHQPELADAKRARYREEYGLSEHDIGILCQNARLCRLLEAAIAQGASPKEAANWILSEVLRLCKERAVDPYDLELDAGKLALILQLLGEGKIDRAGARNTLEAVFADDADVEAYIKKEKLAIERDETAVAGAIAQVLAENADAVEKFRAGNEKVMGFLTGQCMKLLRGKADPKQVSAALLEALR